MFNVDFSKLINWMLPTFRRNPVDFSWVSVLCSPVVQLYNEFMAKRAADLYELAHDSRVFSMQAVFNDRFDNATRRIYVTDGFTKDRLYVFTPTENKPIYIYTPAENNPVYLYNPADYADTGVDFIVWVPTAVTMSSQDMIELTALINKYRLASKRFAIYRV
jgi:hypothetical protein